MINKKIPLDTIAFERVETDEAFLDSIRTRGIAIPVRVRKTENGYECADGRRRLSAAEKLRSLDPAFDSVPVMIVNDFSKAGSAFWGNTRNRH